MDRADLSNSAGDELTEGERRTSRREAAGPDPVAAGSKPVLPGTSPWVWTGQPSSRSASTEPNANSGATSADKTLRGGLSAEDYHRFARHVHQSLDPQATAYTVANECRRLLGCERVTVLWFHRGRFVVKAISGQPAVNRRSKWVQLLEQLANKTLLIGRALEYPGGPQPPQVAKPLEAYLLESRSRCLTMVPIAERDRRLEPEALDLQKKPPSSNRIVAGLVFESLAAEGDYRSDRTALLAAEELGGDALRSAYRHRQLFLYPLWHLLGQTRAVALARRLPVAGIAVGLLLALVALAFYPATFYVSSSGTLVPAIQQRVYAPMDGIVETVLVKPNDWVGAGQPLLRMRNYDLDLKLRQVEGELAIVSEQIDRRRRRDRSPLDANVAAWDELQGTSVAVLESQQANLRERLSLLQQQSLLSVVNSQVAGRVITWNVHEELKQRAVPMGRLLLEVADTTGEWQLELNLPDRRVGHLWNAVRHSKTPLKVEFVMAADPTQRYWGTLLEVAPVTAASTEDGSFVKVRVALDDTGIQVLQTNTEVSARIFCGTASLGYVWLQDVFEFVERQVFFYLW